ncbi:MAG: hypothetical protein U0414_42735 [Polyangiaceae bacterium]
MLKRCPNAEKFLARTVSLGVVDARESDAPPCVFVFVTGQSTPSQRDAICVLARAQWPGRKIILAPRVAIRETGDFPAISLQDDDDLSDVG